MRRAGVAVALALVACGNRAAPAPSSEPPVAARPAAPAKGTVVTTSFRSDALGVDKDVVVYLPAGYDANPTKRWPVIYYLHGLTGDETNWTKLGKLDEAADALGLGAIIVMPDGDNSFYVDASATPDYAACMKDGSGLFIPTQPKAKTCVRAARYETYVVRDLVGWVDRTYRTIPAREARGIAGLSMGGYGALVLGMRHPDAFAVVASHSGVDALLYGGPYPYEQGKVTLITDPKLWARALPELAAWMRGIYGDDLATWQAHDPAVLARQLAPGKLALYLDCGTEDDFKLDNGMRYLHDELVERGIEHEYYLGPGRHNFTFWKERVPHSLAFFQKHLEAAR
ncbi:MAG TPA: alpha/beta hydrolase family protein [Kofleriaceae bacterium]|nr:alpha/beta hydrolase family protein [Kofleriaceae bacterium]